MTDEGTEGVQKPRRIRLPQVDFVTVMLLILGAVLVLFLTAEAWLPHFAE